MPRHSSTIAVTLMLLTATAVAAQSTPPIVSLGGKEATLIGVNSSVFVRTAP